MAAARQSPAAKRVLAGGRPGYRYLGEIEFRLSSFPLLLVSVSWSGRPGPYPAHHAPRSNNRGEGERERGRRKVRVVRHTPPTTPRDPTHACHTRARTHARTRTRTHAHAHAHSTHARARAHTHTQARAHLVEVVPQLLM